MIKLNEIKENIWFSSDLHALHKNICFDTSSWDDKEINCRKFNTPEEMTNVIINNFNKLVKSDDHLFLLGDLLFHYKDVDTYVRLLNRFNCNNIYLLYGNHCNRTNLQLAEDICRGYKTKYLGDYLEIQIDGLMICLFHYPIARWNNRHKKSIMLYGHEHGRFDNGKMSMDVGLDNVYKLFGEYRPLELKEIKELLK